MKVTFFSNYLNHHQIPFCDKMYSLLGDDFTFVSTEPMEEYRKFLGYSFEQSYSYELKSYESDENECKALNLGFESDIVIIGSAPEKYITKRLAENKIVLRYNERIFKNLRNYIIGPRGMRCLYFNHYKMRNKPVFMLCASAFTARDFSLFGAYINKTYKWGYFPKFQTYDVSKLLMMKQNKPIEILWCGRVIDWKHPEKAIKVAQKLKEDGYEFKLKIIGVGNLLEKMKELVYKKGLYDKVDFLEAMKPEKVRENMEKANIFLFTSDHNEGWGAVLNESMNSGCAVVASNVIGSVPFLIENGVNGFTYKNNSSTDLYNKVKILMDNAMLRDEIGTNAYLTIKNDWNSDIAVERLLKLCNELIKYNNDDLFLSGVLSKATIIK